MESTEVVILAAGKGTRMGNDMPKCLLPIKGIPIIMRLLSNIETVFVNKPLLVVGYKSDQIKEVLRDRVRYTHQIEQRGTAHAASIAVDALLPTTKNIVILYGDQPFITEKSIRKLLDGLKKNSITIAVSDGGDFDSWKSVLNNYGRVIYDNIGNIKGVVEYRDASDEIRKISHVNSGCYAFDVMWLKEALKKITTQNSQKEYYLTDIVKVAREDKSNIGHIMIDAFEALGLNSKEDVEYAQSLM